MPPPNFTQLLPSSKQLDTIIKLRKKATYAAYNLLTLIDSRAVWNGDDVTSLQIATTESLTCGLIMSILVDIPWGGFMKYGGFGVYDTDAKRVFNNVSVDDVYTHKCASEMAIGILKNSNATIAISVTGNAMPLNSSVDMLGEVFIGVAGYNQKGEIMFMTKSINACKDNNVDEMKNLCVNWYNTIKLSNGKAYNSRKDTSAISQEIRYYTAIKAYELCIDFITSLNPQVPLEVIQRKQINATTYHNNRHSLIPSNKYEFGGVGICKNKVCAITGNRNTEQTNQYKI